MSSVSEANFNEAVQSVKQALKLLGFFDTTEANIQHIKDTPKRIVKAWLEYQYKDMTELSFTPTVFEENNVNSIQIVKDIQFSSICAHHFLPFTGVCHVAYLPNDKIIGLSKIPRLVNYVSSQPQIQEILVNQIADKLFQLISPKFVMVIMPDVIHTCCSCRGIKSSSRFISSAIRWDDNDDSIDVSSLKEEVIKLLML